MGIWLPTTVLKDRISVGHCIPDSSRLVVPQMAILHSHLAWINCTTWMAHGNHGWKVDLWPLLEPALPLPLPAVLGGSCIWKCTGKVLVSIYHRHTNCQHLGFAKNWRPSFAPQTFAGHGPKSTPAAPCGASACARCWAFYSWRPCVYSWWTVPWSTTSWSQGQRSPCTWNPVLGFSICR